MHNNIEYKFLKMSQFSSSSSSSNSLSSMLFYGLMQISMNNVKSKLYTFAANTERTTIST